MLELVFPVFFFKESVRTVKFGSSDWVVACLYLPPGKNSRNSAHYGFAVGETTEDCLLLSSEQPGRAA
jgi:hypothetical protein